MKKKFSLVIVILGTIGVLATIIAKALDFPNAPLLAALDSFKYFTIQSNVFVIVYFWLLFSLKLDKNNNFHQFLGGVTIYITITGLIFVTMLQNTWHPEGLASIGNILNHYIIPVLVVGYFIYYRKEYYFKFKDVLKWAIYPLSYIVFLIVFGLITNDYIYPFFQIDVVGLGWFIIMFVGILALFAFLSLTLLLLTNSKKQKN